MQQNVQILCVVLPTILIEINRHDEVEETILMCKKIGGRNKLFLHGCLNLMLASRQINDESKLQYLAIKS